jgi:hypothetical protein
MQSFLCIYLRIRNTPRVMFGKRLIEASWAAETVGWFALGEFTRVTGYDTAATCPA